MRMEEKMQFLAKRTQCVPFRKTNRLMLCREKLLFTGGIIWNRKTNGVNKIISRIKVATALVISKL